MVKCSTALIKLLSCLVLLPCVVVACGPAQDDDDDDEYIVVIGSPGGSNPGEQGAPGAGSQQPGQGTQQPGDVGEQGEEMPQGAPVDPGFKRYFDGRVKMAVLDCGCSERDPGVWGTIMTKEQCVDNWQRHLGDQQSISCQNRLIQESPSARSYVQCLADADQALVDAWGGQCPGSYNVLDQALSNWNFAKFNCQVAWPGERAAFEGCAAHVTQDFSPVLDRGWTFFSKSNARGGSFLTLDNEAEQSLGGQLGWTYFLVLRSNGTFNELARIRGGGTYIDERSDWGVWNRPDAGNRVMMSSNCNAFAPTRFFVGFQRLFLGHYKFKPFPVSSLPAYFQKEHTVGELCP